MATHKIMLWCAYQERSQHDTRTKLFDFGLNPEEVESILATLIAENYVNEERFALAFASGKFRIKHWGRIKIKLELKKHKVSDYCLRKALASIPDEEYTATIRNILEKKSKSAKKGDPRKTYYALLNYCVSRGFEPDLVREVLNEKINTNFTELE
mgnify:CR=1 FL=1